MDLTPILLEFFKQHHLMDVVACQSIRTRDPDVFNRGLTDSVTQSVETRSVECGATIAVVTEDVFGKQFLALAVQMDPQALDRFRKAVADNKRGRELDRILAALSKKGFSVDSHGTYARVPKGFAPDHPRAELLKWKGLICRFPAMPARLLYRPELARWLLGHARATAPLVVWSRRHLG